MGQYVYKIDRSELNSELEQLASIYAALKERVKEGYGDSSIGHIFERVFEEHFRILDSKLTVKPSSELASSCLQSPDDEDATYRFKRGKAYRGQVLNVTETCNPENEGKLITDVHVTANNRDDSDVLEERIDRILEKTPELVQLHTDEAYGSLENDDKLGARGVEQIQTSIRSQEPKVEISIGVLPNGHYEVRCPMHSTEGIKTKTRWKALMEKRVCDTCLLWNECSTRIGKKARVLYFNEHYIVRHKRYRAIERLPEELRKLRANVEATIQ